jgi:hypothetical protein
MSLVPPVAAFVRIADSVSSPEPFSASSPLVVFLLGAAILIVVIVVIRRLLRARIENQRRSERGLRVPTDPPETP